MWKRFVVCALLTPLATVGILSGEHALKGTPKQGVIKQEPSKEGKEQPQTQPSNNPTPNPLTAATQPTAPTANKPSQDSSEDQKIQRWLMYFTGALVIVGVLQFISIFWQAWLLRGTLREIKTQAGQMERQTAILEKSVAVAQKSADTTSQQVELYVNAERARITIDIADSGRSFRIRGKNTGRVVAQVRRASGYSLILPYGEQLPPVPSYLSEPDTLGDFVESAPPDEFIAPMDEDGNDLMMNLSDPDLCAAIRDKQSALWVFGRFVYSDGISPKRRELRFCYEADVDQKMETNINMSGPGIYRLET